MKKPSVSIGIPAYNEEKNIKNLLKALLQQNSDGYILTKIIIVSDGSTDKTVSEVNSLENTKIKIQINPDRLGQPEVQNLIINQTDSDILVLLNADVIPAGKNFIKNIILPFKKYKNVGLVGAKVTSLKPTNWFEKILVNAANIKNLMYEDINGGNNIYLCHGRARAFSRRFYHKLRFPAGEVEDAFSYLICRELNFDFYYQPNARVYFRNPTNLKDHLRQSTRFFKGMDGLAKRFTKDVVMKEYFIPNTKLLKFSLLGLIKSPVNSLTYALILMLSKIIVNLKLGETNHLWQVSVSSKKL